ncbi:MAG: phosphatidate cytidylyltransferase [Acidobacteria bacterium]|nr:phosphatidate cytidylyltransferase [Acidobacteriota bacterium]
MLTRIVSGLVLLAVVVAVVVALPPWGTIALAAVVVALASHEFARLAGPGGFAALPMVVATVASSLAMAFGGPVSVVLLAALIVVGALAVGRGRPDEDALRQVGVALAAPVYIGVPAGAILALRVEFGPWALLAALLTVMASDIAQFFGGRALGRRLLAPVVSPKKTVEGAVSGVAAAAVVLPALGAWWLPGAGMLWLAILGVLMALLGIVGDLFESLIKRSAGVKDSSSLIPGHGGMLDRVDSLLFAVPVLYVWLRYATP